MKIVATPEVVITRVKTINLTLTLTEEEAEVLLAITAYISGGSGKNTNPRNVTDGIGKALESAGVTYPSSIFGEGNIHVHTSWDEYRAHKAEILADR